MRLHEGPLPLGEMNPAHAGMLCHLSSVLVPPLPSSPPGPAPRTGETSTNTEERRQRRGKGKADVLRHYDVRGLVCAVCERLKAVATSASLA
jgi:hypothetical protein